MMATKHLLYPAVFVATLLFYCLFLARMGYEEWDTGFISGLSWRIINGEVMYEDFIYTKPPVTPYLNSIFLSILPDQGQFYYIRCVNYLLFALQVYFTVSALNNLYSVKERLGIALWGVITAGFIISYLNVSPYPWYTQDGLLFTAVALWLKSRLKQPSLLPLFLIALSSVVAALCKQSFYLIPLLFLGWIFVDYGIKKALVFGLYLLILGSLFFLIIAQMTDIENFIKLVTGQTHLYDLYFTNIYGYAHKHIKIYMVLVLLAVLAGINFKNIKETKFKTIFKWFIIMQMLTGCALFIAHDAGRGSILAFNSCVFAVAYHYLILNKSIKYLFPLFAILVIAWSASVSWGYPFPIFYLTGIILTFLILLRDIAGPVKPVYYTFSGVIFCLVGLSYNYEPYRSGKITELTYELSPISPKLQNIHGNERIYNNLNELKYLVEKYKAPYMVTTNYSHAHYLFNTRNPASADWMINSEISFDLDKMLSEASQSSAYIFLEENYDPVLEGGGPMHKSYSLFSQFVKKNLTPVEKSGYFTVYNAKEIDEVLR